MGQGGCFLQADHFAGALLQPKIEWPCFAVRNNDERTKIGISEQAGGQALVVIFEHHYCQIIVMYCEFVTQGDRVSDIDEV